MNEAVDLRDWRDSDVPELARLANDRLIWDFGRDEFPHPYSEVDARDYIRTSVADDALVSRAVILGGVLAGSIELRRKDDIRRHSAVLSYWIGAEYRGRGVATAAIRHMTALAFNELGLHRVYAKVFAENGYSVRALESAGYRREGEFRDGVFKNGAFHDQLLYAITPG